MKMIARFFIAVAVCVALDPVARAADSTTPNYGWSYPTVGADSSTWGNTINNTIIAIDGQMKANANAAAPVASPTFTGTITAPDNSSWNSNGITGLGSLGLGGGGIVKNAYNNNISPNGTLQLSINPGGGSWAGILIVSVVYLTDANVRTQTEYAISARGTTIDAITPLNSGSYAGGMSFSLSYPSAGVIEVTNNTAATAIISMTWIGANGG